VSVQSDELFEAYMTEIDRLCFVQFGIGSAALDDYDYRDAFDSNLFPRDVVAKLAIREI
jgi:hypothetical protein